MPSTSAREHALVKAGVYELVEGKCAEGEEWYRDTEFAEIPAQLLRRSMWTECLHGRWKDVEDSCVFRIADYGSDCLGFAEARAFAQT